MKYDYTVPEPNIDPLWMAWFAGLMDGEGSFVMECSIRQVGERGNWSKREIITFSPTVVIKMHVREAKHLDKIQEVLGFGKRYQVFRHPHEAVSWQTTKTAETLGVCRLLEPYLVIKHTHAVVLAQACEAMLDWRDLGGYQMPERIWELYQIRENLNPDCWKNPRRLVLTQEEVSRRFPYRSPAEMHAKRAPLKKETHPRAKMKAPRRHRNSEGILE